MDPITLGVIWGALQSIAVEIGTTVHRTAYSEQAREGQDFSVAVFDPRGRMVAQGPYSPGHMGAMSFAVKNALAAHPVETLRPGDAVLLNDPLLGSGHLPDFFVTQPAFHENELVGFAVNILHHTDVGGARPGSQGVEGISDYFQEGLRIPPTKVWREYREDPGIVGIIAANTRTPDKVLGDLRAQRSALRVGELRLQELAARYGRDVLAQAMDEIIARTEANMRVAIGAFPDGVYTFEDFMDDYGPGTEPLRVAVTVTVAGDSMVIDYAGSSSQTPSGMNSYINYTRSYSYAAVKCLADPLGPMNEGALRPITVQAPEGSFLNPRPPAGGGPRAIICYRVFESVVGALARAVPERVAAAASHMANPTFGGWDRARARRFVAYELVLAGTGARATKDGCEAMSWAFNASNIPVEAQEANQPIVVERFELVRDSAGAGKFRGGCGVRRDMRFLADEGKLTNLSDRQKFAPYGLFGGRPGRLGRTVINPGLGEQVVHGKASREFAYGDVVSFQQPGAGGYGDPLERDSARVLEDVLDDYVSIEAARADYGVVITGNGTDLRIDDRATLALREGHRAAAISSSSANHASCYTHERYECQPEGSTKFPAGKRPPELYGYPTITRPIRVLFMGWNPPRPFQGFWRLEEPDDLRNELHLALRAAEWVVANEPDGAFLNEFLERGYYFVHAVKCWTESRYPGFGRDSANRQGRREIGEPLLKACVSTHIPSELQRLSPGKVCALGELPYLGLRHLYPQLDRNARPTQGRMFGAAEAGLAWDLLYTCLPVRNRIGRRWAREYVAEHLAAWHSSPR